MDMATFRNMRTSTPRQWLVAVAATLVLAACGGGGGGSGGGGGGGTTNFNTAEFQANYGLSKIGALTAYNNNGTGSGITVAVVDTGIDVNNAEFSGAIAAASTDIVTNNKTFLQDPSTSGHGTAVAGVIGARRNSAGTHGVAFNSTILAIRTDTVGSCFTSCTFTDDNIAKAINHAVSNGARVINISLGGSSAPNTALQNALQNAVNNNVAVIAAAGNSGGSEALFTARLANCTGGGGLCNGFNAQGKMIAVGATDQSNAIASFSNRAGDTASGFLVAPGVGIVTTNLLSLGGGTRTVNGTSFAAPHVAGALAVVMQRFPTMTTAQAVSLLFTSATDLGANGTDTTFGRGLLNLAGAFQSQGLTSLPTGNKIGDSSEDLRASALTLGPAFGNALQSKAFLSQAIVLDAFDRPFNTDLRNVVQNATVDPGVAGFIAAPPGDVRRIATGSSGSLALTMGPAIENREDLLDFGNVAPPRDAQTVQSAFYQGHIGSDVGVSLALNASSTELFDDVARFAGAASPFVGLEFVNAPQLSLVGKGDGGGASYRLDDRTRISLGFMETETDPFTDQGGDSLIQASLTHGLSFGPVLRVGVGFAQENAAMFNSTSSGAFGAIGDSESTFVTFGASVPVSATLAAHASYTAAQADVLYAGDGYLNNWSSVLANAFSFGLTQSDLFQRGDRAGLAVYQPLRVYGAQADLTIPVGTEPVPGGAIHYQSERVDVTPTGREIDLQLAYRWHPTRTINAATYGVMMVNPGHDNSAKPAFGTGIRLWLDF